MKQWKQSFWALSVGVSVEWNMAHLSLEFYHLLVDDKTRKQHDVYLFILNILKVIFISILYQA